MDKQKLQILLDSLLNRSVKGELNWKTTGNPYTYLLTLKDSSISVSKESATVELALRNERGEVIERTEIIWNDELHQKASKLFDLSRAKARNEGDLIDRVIEQLKPDSIAA